MSLIKWNQPAKLTGRRNWIENFFMDTDDFFKNWDWDRTNEVPAVNVTEEKEAFFKIELDRGVLMISATSELTKEEKTDEFKRREFSYRNFKRSFWLPENVKADQIAATYENGLLKLRLPKLAELPAEKSKRIKVV